MIPLAHDGLHSSAAELFAGSLWWLLPAVFLGLGLLVGRLYLVFLPALLWIGLAAFLIENDGWHGFGWGDLGVRWNVAVALLSVGAVAVGVALRRYVSLPPLFSGWHRAGRHT